MGKDMEIRVKSRYLHISPRKLRLIIAMVIGKNAQEAEQILRFQTSKGAKMAKNLLGSALAIAKSSEVKEDSFAIRKFICNQGPRLKRGKPGSKGRVMPIARRQSHLELVLSDHPKLLK